MALNVVLANGTAIHVSEKSNPELFWAMKGAGHNFGVVTSFEMRIYPRPVDLFYYRLYTWRQESLEAIFEQLNLLHNNGTHAKELIFNMGVYTLDDAISNEASRDIKYPQALTNILTRCRP